MAYVTAACPIAYKDMPVLEQLSMLCGAAQQAGVSETLIAEFQTNIRNWILTAQHLQETPRG